MRRRISVGWAVKVSSSGVSSYNLAPILLERNLTATFAGSKALTLNLP